ncbi:hypothetical protein BDP27DRAFT_1170318, partial [Rhodocollybia butyracea]
AEEIHERFPKMAVELILTDIFQSERLQSATKDVGRYSAFVSLESKRLNAEVPEGQPRRKVHEMSSEIAAKWRELSEAEKNEATKEELAHLRDRRANKEIGEHQVPAAAAQDTLLTLERVKENLRRLTARTGDEHLLITTRGTSKIFHKPYIYTIPVDMGYRMDAFMVSGVEGLARTQVQVLMQLKKDISQLIFRKLQECMGKTKVGRMVYRSFVEQITRRYGVVVKNWPLREFKNPSSIGTKTELELLLSSWNTDATYFYRMTSLEFGDW